MNHVIDDFSRTHGAVETRYRQAHLCLEEAQALRTEAVCQFLEAQALWKADAGDAFSPRDAPCEPGDALSLAEADLSQAKSVYCAVLEQSQLVQWLLEHARDTYRKAQEKLERLALGEQGG